MELNTQALVLGTERYTETDVLVFLFTQNNGLLTARARGARKISSKAAHTIVSPSYIYVRLVDGKQHPYFTSSEVLNEFSSIKRSFSHLSTSLFCNRLVRKMVEEDHPDPDLFEFLISYFQLLNSSPESNNHYSQWHRSIFIVQLLSLLGLLADFGHYDTIQSNHVSPYSQRIVGEIQNTSLRDLFQGKPPNKSQEVLNGALYFLARQLNTPPATLARMF